MPPDPANPAATGAAAPDTAASDPAWTDVLAADALPPGGRKVVKPGGGKQIAVFRRADGVVHACNNRCPHEGYPLAEGSLAEGSDGCLLTCNWHNWKFDLESGETLVGGDSLRLYPARESDGRILLDLSDPPPAARIAAALDALVDAFDRHEYDRMAREIARLERAGGDPMAALARTVEATADRFEFGVTHALPAAADWLRLRADREDPAERLAALLEAVAHFAWDSRREPRYPYPDGTAAWDADAFVAAVEAEDEAAALARVRGALDAGLGWDDMAPAFARAALAYYADFGHSAIYTLKTGELLAHLPAERPVREAVLALLVRALVYATREDLIPEFRAYAPALAAWDGTGTAVPDPDRLARGSVREVLTAMTESSADPAALFDAAMTAAARQMLHFDVARERMTDIPVSQNVGWLAFTHALTFGNAVRRLAAREPALWPAGLLQIGCFLGRNAGFVDWSQDVSRWRVDDPAAFHARVLDGMVDHGEGEYIVSAHMLKTATALAEEAAARPGAPWHGEAAAALNRFLAHAMKRKHALRTARQSRAFVAAEG